MPRLTPYKVLEGGPEEYSPKNLFFDKKNAELYIAENSKHIVRKISPSGIITTIAGTGVQGYNGDGISATAAQLNYPEGVEVDPVGNIYISDQGNYRIRKISATGIISTYAGNGISSYFGNGFPATAAQFVPTYIKFDEMQNLYITGDSRVSVVDYWGIFHALAGTGVAGFSGDGGPAVSAQFDHNHDVALDSCGNIYVTDGQNNRVRKVTYTHCRYLGFENNKLSSKNLTIYPNPVNDMLYVDDLSSIANYSL